jgi:hypothetical protein
MTLMATASIQAAIKARLGSASGNQRRRMMRPSVTKPLRVDHIM